MPVIGPTATFTWTTTGDPSSSQVEYGPTLSYGTLTPIDVALVTSHSVTVTGLTPGAYHWRARSRNSVGTETVSEDQLLTVSPTDALTGVLLARTGVISVWSTQESAGTTLADSGVNNHPLTLNGAISLFQAGVVPIQPESKSVGFPGSTTAWLDGGNLDAWSILTTGKLSGGCAFNVPSLPAFGLYYTLMTVSTDSNYEWALRVAWDGRVEYIAWDLGGGTLVAAGVGTVTPGAMYYAMFTVNTTKAGTFAGGAARGNIYLIPATDAIATTTSVDLAGTFGNGPGAFQIGRRGDAQHAMPSGGRIAYPFISGAELALTDAQAIAAAFRSLLTGSEPNPTGTLTRIWHARRTATGSQPSATGSAVRGLTHYHKSVSGIEAFTSAFVSNTVNRSRILAGSVPEPTGAAITPKKPVLAGSQPYPVGGLSDVTVLRAMNWGARMQMWLPEMWYARALRMLTILAAEGDTFDQATVDIDEVRNARLPQTAPDWGIERLESEAGLPPRPELSLINRRARVLAHFRGIGSTLYRLKSISQAWDYGNVSVVADPESYTLYITFIDQRGVPIAIEDHKAEMRTNVLAHLGLTWQYTYLVWGDPKRLGITWGQLKTAGRTWGQLKTMKPEALP